MNRILWFMRHPATSGIFVCTAILASGNLPASAQTAVSPYTIYGIGALDNGNHGSGLGIGLREKNTLNSANPAALTAIDEKTFLLDIAASGSISGFSGQSRRAVSGNGNVDRIALGFRVGRFLTMSAGAGISFASDKFTAGIDYSFYKYSSLDTDSDIIKYKDRNRLTAGITYVPSRYDVHRYWKRIKFQMGAYVDDSYLTASGSRGLKFDRYTFPVSNRNTISESSLGLTFGVTFGESWFVRKRLE